MFIKVLAELRAQHGWDTVYCVSKGTEELLKHHFPAAIYHDTHDARYGRPAREFADLPWRSLDQAEAENLGYTEVTAFKQMDRLAIMDSFMMHERFLHFHRLVSYWSQVIDRLKPDLLLMPTSPHVVYDYIAYQLARRRGVRTIMFEYVTTEGWLVAIDRFEDGIPPLTDAYAKVLANPPPDPVVLSDRMEDYLRRLNDRYSVAMPQATREFLLRAEVMRRAEAEGAAKELAGPDAERPCTGSGRSAIGEPEDLLARFLRRFGLQRLPNSETISRHIDGIAASKPPPSTDGHYRGRFYADSELPEEVARLADKHRRRHQQTISRRYRELSVVPDLSRPYVYVPLHLQPERSTNPIGGVFDDQYVMIGMISSVLPSGWRIYVKEHPSQFAPQFASERGRWTSLYEALMGMPNVELVSLETGSFDLIDNAQAVATITGTSSWEAVVRGIPTLVFGEPWYKGCPGSYTIRSTEECRRVLTNVSAGERPDASAIRLFLKAAEEVSFIGYICADDEPIAGIDEETNVRRMTGAIKQCHAAGSTIEGAGY